MWGFAQTDYEPSVVRQTAVKISDCSGSGVRQEIHQHVAAEDDIHGVGVTTEQGIGILRQIVIGKRHHFFDDGQDFKVSASYFPEVVVPDPVRIVAKLPFAVHPGQRFFEKIRVNVRAQNGDLPVRQILDQSAEQDSYGIRLLAGGAAGAPDPQASPGFPFDADQFRQN